MLTATLDKPTYAPGEEIALTVTSTKRTASQTIPISSGGEGASVTLVVRQAVFVTDDTSRKWSLISDDGVTAVFGSVA